MTFKSVKLFQGDRVIKQLWERRKNECRLVEHTVTDESYVDDAEIVRRKTTISFEGNTARVKHDVKGDMQGHLRFTGQNIKNIQSKVDDAVAKKSHNVFETLANESLKNAPEEPYTFEYFSSKGIENQEIKKVFSGNAIPESKGAFCTAKINPMKFHIKNITGAIGKTAGVLLKIGLGLGAFALTGAVMMVAFGLLFDLFAGLIFRKR